MNTKKPGGRPTPRRTPQASDGKTIISGFSSFKSAAHFLLEFFGPG
jgi:hypothetical protein